MFKAHELLPLPTEGMVIFKAGQERLPLSPNDSFHHNMKFRTIPFSTETELKGLFYVENTPSGIYGAGNVPNAIGRFSEAKC